jgi:predicted secreted protein
MAASSAVAAFGTLIKRAGTTIPEVQSVSWDAGTQEYADVTHMESPNSYHERVATLKEGGTVSIEASYLPANAVHKALITDMQAGSSAAYTIVVPGTATWSFTAFVESVRFNAPHDGKLGMSVSLKVTGAMTPPA